MVCLLVSFTLFSDAIYNSADERRKFLTPCLLWWSSIQELTNIDINSLQRTNHHRPLVWWSSFAWLLLDNLFSVVDSCRGCIQSTFVLSAEDRLNALEKQFKRCPGIRSDGHQPQFFHLRKSNLKSVLKHLSPIIEFVCYGGPLAYQDSGTKFLQSAFKSPVR